MEKDAAMLSKQMDAFIAFRIKVENPQAIWVDKSVELEMTRLASDVAASTAELTISTPAGARTSSKCVYVPNFILRNYLAFYCVYMHIHACRKRSTHGCD